MPTWVRGLVVTLALTVAPLGLTGSANAQTKLKWAHVYEVVDPDPTEALLAVQ